MLVLVTGATGKVGRRFIERFLDDERGKTARVRALCHNRVPEPRDRLETVHGDIAKRADVERAIEGVTHVLHLATCKETPADVMDVTVKGLFWLLEAFRSSATAQQFILIGGDAAIGHFHYEYDAPITETVAHRAYPGCYALSKVLEEVMLQQYCIQYEINACCLGRHGSWRRTTSSSPCPSATTCSAGRSGRTRCRARRAKSYSGLRHSADPARLESSGR